MALSPGTRLGPYEITAQIGVGGMGEVYQATDTSLARQVAIKVLPEAVAGDAERLARFDREAKTLAALNHPNIAQIHGLEKSPPSPGAGGTTGTLALVMELVEGPTLAERIAQGAIPVDEALPIARQIALALEAAHERGIIHRDLKPANVKVRPDGTVKVLDFGLAKAIEAGGSRQPVAGVSMSPTITTPAVTQAGMILGTAAYMSPEQARGRPVDARADIWAFGVVFYEMLTGRRAFDGDDATEVLGAVVRLEPNWDALPVPVPGRIRQVMRACLQKNVQQRLAHMQDVRLALDGAFEAAQPALTQSDARVARGWRRAVPYASGAAVASLVVGLAGWSLWPAAEPPSPVRFDHALAEGQTLVIAARPAVAVSPDGRSFLYQTTQGLHVRSIGELEARLLPGTDGPVTTPFFSPDGQWVGFAVDNTPVLADSAQLKKVAVAGGMPVTLCQVGPIFGASWGPDNTVLFGQPTGIMRVSANGGAPALVAQARDGEEVYGPQLLPGGRSILFSVTKDVEQGIARWNRGQVVVQSVASGDRTVVVNDASDARYLDSGHLVYVSGNTLFGVAFDASQPTDVTGAVPLVQGIQRPVNVAAAGTNYAVSEQGTLVYVPAIESSRELVWVNRDGTPAGRVESIPAGAYDWPRLSADGSRVLLTKDADIWIYDLGSGRSRRLTRDGSSQMGVWNPGGTQVAYSSAARPEGNLEAFVTPSDGSGEPRQLTRLGGQVHVDAWAPDGRMLTIHHHSPDGRTRMFALPVDEAAPTPQALTQEGLNAEGAHFSRDGRYIAHLSLEARAEVAIRPYPGPGGEQTVTMAGGREPVWAANGDLFYRNPGGERMFAVSIATKPVLTIGTPVELFQGPYYVSRAGSPRAQYDVTPDGQRLLMLAPNSGSSATRPRVVVVLNWTEELKRLVPTR